MESIQEERSKRQRAPPTCTSPWLLLQQGDYYEDQTFYILSPLPSQECYARKRIPELRGNMIVGCYYGWLLLRDTLQPGELCLFDSVSLKMILLPTLEEEEEEIDSLPVFTLTAPPDDPNCFVLLFDECRAIFCRPRTDDRWTVQKTLVEDSRKEIEIRNPISCNGVIYAEGFTVNDSGSLRLLFVSIEVISNDQPGAQLLMIVRSLQAELPFVPLPTLVLRQNLVESSGELFAVIDRFNLQDIHHVEVYRLERDIGGRMIWAGVKNLKGRALFIGFNCNASLRMSSHESVEGLLLRENSIYFTFNGDEGIYRYGLEDRSLTPFLPCPDLRKLTGDPPFWVVPLPHQSNGFDNRRPEDCKNFTGKGTVQTRVMTTGRQSEKDEKEDECGADQSFISSLPLDIIALFARCLPLSDYLNFRVVCKRFLKAAPRIDLIARSIVSEDHTDSAPSLLFLDRIDGKLCNLIDPSSDNNHNLYWSSTAPTFLKKATITFSSKGWLILGSDCAVVQSYNPITRTSVKYPAASLQGTIWGFSSCPTSPDCVIVGMDCIGGRSKFYYLRHGDEDWNCYDLAAKFPFKRSDNTPVYYKGAFYYLDRNGKLGAFELTENGCAWKIMKKKGPCRKPSQENYLVECDGMLLSVFVGKLGRWVEVFRLHRPTMTWKKVQNLGGYMLFLSRASSFSMPAISAGMENRIYFLRFLHGSALYYSLDTREYYSDGTEYPVDDFRNSKLLLHSCWIQPTQP